MKNLFTGMLAMTLFMASCSDNSEKTEVVTEQDMQTATVPEMPIDAEDTALNSIKDNTKTDGVPAEVVVKETVNDKNKTTEQQKAFNASKLIDGYLILKTSLTEDDSKSAAAAGKAMVATLSKIDASSLSATDRKKYNDITADLKEHAGHIGDNANSIEHQREHLVMLSRDVDDLVKMAGTGGKTLYKEFCPMANDGKGAYWLSTEKDIKNPYYGSSMLTCGSVKATYKK